MCWIHLPIYLTLCWALRGISFDAPATIIGLLWLLICGSLRKLKHREVKQFDQGFTASPWRSWDMSSGSLTLEPNVFNGLDQSGSWHRHVTNDSPGPMKCDHQPTPQKAIFLRGPETFPFCCTQSQCHSKEPVFCLSARLPSDVLGWGSRIISLYPATMCRQPRNRWNGSLRLAVCTSSKAVVRQLMGAASLTLCLKVRSRWLRHRQVHKRRLFPDIDKQK